MHAIAVQALSAGARQSNHVIIIIVVASIVFVMVITCVCVLVGYDVDGAEPKLPSSGRGTAAMAGKSQRSPSALGGLGGNGAAFKPLYDIGQPPWHNEDEPDGR